jgi:hypothetical protein
VEAVNGWMAFRKGFVFRSFCDTWVIGSWIECKGYVSSRRAVIWSRSKIVGLDDIRLFEPKRIFVRVSDIARRCWQADNTEKDRSNQSLSL